MGRKTFWASWDCPCSFFSYLGFDLIGYIANMRVLGLRAKAMMRTRLLAWINSPSDRFSFERISADGTHPGMPGLDQFR